MTEPGSAPGSGERIGAYEIQGPLGRGGMGEVFLAWDARLRRKVAIKRIRHDHGLNPAMRQRLLREARAAAGLSHPAIVQVHDLIEDATGDCIVLEYVEGRTLAATLAEAGRLEPEAAVRLAGEIAGGLAAAHAAGIVHRDLKTENVIVTPAGRAKILDFGLARMSVPAADDPVVTQHGVLLGTFHTMSPEQASGEETDERSDLFSLGVLLYEMLTGRSPFRGSSPTETLRKVLSEIPPRVDAVRPGLPRRLGDLVERLLAKEPADRPGSAAEVARELEALASALASEAPTQVASVSELPTVVDIPRSATPPPLSRPLQAPVPTASMSALHRPRMRMAVLAVLGMAVLSVLVFLAARPLLVRKPEAPAVTTAPLRVVVLQPKVAGKDERLGLAALGAQTTALSTLSSLVGVDASDLRDLFGSPATLPEVARSGAADELLEAVLDEAGERGKITLRRKTPQGQELWSESFYAPIDPGHLLQLARAVDASLLRGYKDRRLRPGTPALEARTEDYAAFLDVKHRLDSGGVPSQEDLDRLQQIMDKSPSLLDVRLLAASVLYSRSISTRKVAYRDRALDLVRGAHGLAPEDPRPLLTQIKIELAQDQPKAAAKALEQLEVLLPGDPRVLVLRSNLAEREGRLDEALEDLRNAAKASPTWRNLAVLANLEARTGHVEEARGHFRQILANSPNNIFALDGLAGIELLFGDLQEAEQRYQDLIARTPKPFRAHYANLGAARMLLGHYEDAIAAFRLALEIDPDSATVNSNLGQAELALGHKRAAEEHFQKALLEIEKNPVEGNRLTQAECLAFLGRHREAVSIILQLLEQKRDDPDVLKSAALVSAVVGDHATALAYIEKALQKGVQPRWFLMPGYNSLRDNPEFQELFKTPGALLPAPGGT
ncbi:MAG TPA: protein kinase [Thermoanaerobaculia bacterium]